MVLTMKNENRGFSLIELVVTIAIVGILAAIALPAYTQYVIRANRNAAMAQMVEIANREQQYFQATRTYADKATLSSNGYALPAEVAERYSWDVTVGSGTVPTYTITFTGIGAQVSDNDLGNLTLDQSGAKAPAEKWKR